MKRLLILALLTALSCTHSPQPPKQSAAETLPVEKIPPVSGQAAPAPNPQAKPIQYVDVTREAGIQFRHVNGAFGQKYLPETMGAGCAFLDVDGDGWQDILLVNSTIWPGQKGQKGYPALYKNNRDGTFTDITKQAGLMVELYGMGVAVGDYDNDGKPDVYITALGQSRLFHNLGESQFEDVTAKAGLTNSNFSTSAAWLDYDKDGHLDLFVCNYVEWSIEKDLFCTLDGKTKSYCKPDSYKGQSVRLYRNRSNGQFEDVTERAGLLDPTCKALGVTVLDYDMDGWQDIFVANDTEPNKLYHNNRNGTFTDQAVSAGVAFNEAGVARAGMGTDAADFDGSGYPSLIVGNFSNEMLALYHNEGTGLFIDEAPPSTIGQSTLLSLTFGCFFYDYDLDGFEDIFLANGHVADDINKVQPKITYAQAPKLFRNLGQKRFEEVSRRLGAEFQQPLIGRGAAYGDYDNDGDLDLLISCNNGLARLYRNESANQNRAFRVKTVGVRSNRDGIGAVVTVKASDGSSHWKVVKSGSSYCSQSELPLTFGLGQNERVSLVEVRWPSGQVDKVIDLPADRVVTLREGEGVISNTPLEGKR